MKKAPRRVGTRGECFRLPLNLPTLYWSFPPFCMLNLIKMRISLPLKWFRIFLPMWRKKEDDNQPKHGFIPSCRHIWNTRRWLANICLWWGAVCRILQKRQGVLRKTNVEITGFYEFITAFSLREYVDRSKILLNGFGTRLLSYFWKGTAKEVEVIDGFVGK